MDVNDELLNYEQQAQTEIVLLKQNESNKGHYVGISSIAFRDFLLKPELLHAIADCGFEHPSQVQQECIPQALLGTDVICQGKSGMGKTAVFVISILQQLDPVPGEISALVLAPTRELAYQITKEFLRFTKYMPNVETVVIFGGVDKKEQLNVLNNKKPQIIVATPGRCLDFLRNENKKAFNLSKLRYFVIDEADKCFEKEELRKDIQQIVRNLPKDKQVMLFSATMPEDKKQICRSFTKNAVEVFVDDDQKLTLHGLQQHYVKLPENEKLRKLVHILENFKFNQVVIFVKSVERANRLTKVLNEVEINTIAVHGGMNQQERISAFTQFKEFKQRILVCTDVFARGIDIERVNIVVNYDVPDSTDTYLHRVGRAGRFGTKGLAITFIVDEEDQKIHEAIQSRFHMEIKPLPEEIPAESYMNA